jgi:hypothetical protein
VAGSCPLCEKAVPNALNMPADSELSRDLHLNPWHNRRFYEGERIAQRALRT